MTIRPAIAISAALLVLASGTGLTSASSAELHLGQSTTRWEPTRPGFAKPFSDTLSRTVDYGDLICTSTAIDNCRVANMPLLSQVKPALKSPLKTYAAKYIISSGPNAGTIAWAEPQLGTPETFLAPTDFAQQILDYGCYIASLTTLEHAVLADEPAAARPESRADVFNNIAAGSLLPGRPQPINQLEWQYQRWVDKLQPNIKHPSQPSNPDFLELAEFASDIAGAVATMQDNSAPTYMKAGDLIYGMKSGQTYLIAFQRYNVSASAPDAHGVIRISLTYDSQHKIVVSGFQTGTYPLEINDVGNGERYRVRLTSDTTSIPFMSGSTVVPTSKLKFTTPTGGPVAAPSPPVFLVYEGSDGVTLGSGDQLFVVVDYESLSIASVHRPIVPRTGGTTPY